MKTMKILQVMASVGVLAVGTLFAVRGYADDFSCSFEKPWGYNSPGSCDCDEMACFYSGDKGASDAYVAVVFQPGDGGWTPVEAFIVGLNSSGEAIPGCNAVSTTANGHTVETTTGCESGVTLYMEADGTGG
jgi:hypothetical protein